MPEPARLLDPELDEREDDQGDPDPREFWTARAWWSRGRAAVLGLSP